VADGVSRFLATFPDAHYSDLEVFVCGERGAAQWTFSGTRDDGTRDVYRGCDLFSFEGDLVRTKDAFRKERARPLA